LAFSADRSLPSADALLVKSRLDPLLILGADMSKVFSTAESVNKELRALITVLPKAKRQKAEKQWQSRTRLTREDNRCPVSDRNPANSPPFF
jgi:hypothetical protein